MRWTVPPLGSCSRSAARTGSLGFGTPGAAWRRGSCERTGGSGRFGAFSICVPGCCLLLALLGGSCGLMAPRSFVSWGYIDLKPCLCSCWTFGSTPILLAFTSSLVQVTELWPSAWPSAKTYPPNLSAFPVSWTYQLRSRRQNCGPWPQSRNIWNIWMLHWDFLGWLVHSQAPFLPSKRPFALPCIDVWFWSKSWGPGGQLGRLVGSSNSPRHFA